MKLPTLSGLRGLGRRVPPADRLGAGLSRVDWPTVLELALLALLAVQAARLMWAVVTPVGSFGDWRGRQAVIPSPAARQALFATFDPFYRTQAPEGGSAVVTSLSLTLFGVRVNEGSGLGSAIIATPDGMQNSYAVGDEIIPGVMLKAVAFDHVVIDRGGAAETVFLDQSQAAPVAAPAWDDTSQAGSDAPPQNPVLQDVTASAIKSDIGFAPRTEGAQITGLVLSPRGPAFQAAGFRPGDVVVQVNGRPIGSASDLQALQSQLVPGARISLSVERGASVVPIALTLQGQ